MIQGIGLCRHIAVFIIGIGMTSLFSIRCPGLFYQSSQRIIIICCFKPCAVRLLYQITLCIIGIAFFITVCIGLLGQLSVFVIVERCPYSICIDNGCTVSDRIIFISGLLSVCVSRCRYTRKSIVCIGKLCDSGFFYLGQAF